MEEHWYNKIETQIGTTVGAVSLYSFTLNELIGVLTVILLLGQIGIVAYKYYGVIKEWVKSRKKKHGN